MDDNGVVTVDGTKTRRSDAIVTELTAAVAFQVAEPLRPRSGR